MGRHKKKQSCKYINGDSLLLKVQSSPGIDPIVRMGLCALIEREPVVDLVKVIRCKDCAFWISNLNGTRHHCEIGGLSCCVSGESYCSRGERGRSFLK